MFPRLTTKLMKAAMETGAGNSFRAVISADSLDRDAEVLLPHGCDTTEFLKSGSGTIFWNHNYDQPIGKALSVKRRGDALVSDFSFAERPDDYEGDDFFPDYIKALVAQGVVKGVSVGFAPIETRMPTARDQERYGQEVRRVISKWKLYEWSIAPMQSNTDAIVEGVAKGVLSRSLTLKHFADVPAIASALNAPALPFR